MTSQRPGVNAAILASRVPYNTGLFVLGPFAERVSFASQQRRAMNLVWSINQNLCKSGDSEGLKKKNVVVVGAGLAGLTAAVALRLYGAMVTILDRQTELMGPMASAAHRDIHPTINFWPTEDLSVSTNFPFFNWYQGSCDQILKRIREEWSHYQAEYNIIGPNLGCEVTAIEQQADGSWALSVSEAGTRYTATHDIVVLATGFGRERDLASGDPGYWDCAADPIQHIQANDLNPFQNYVVSGTGDGGLIEVFRLLFKSFRAGQIENATAPLVNDKTLSELVQRIEAEVRQHVVDAILHEGAKLSEGFKDDISTRLWEKYSDCASRWVGPGAKDELKRNRSAIPHVVLLGRRPTPLEYGAAPYHRLLLTICILHGWITYYQVEETCVSDTGRPVMLPSASKPFASKHVEINASRSVGKDGDQLLTVWDTVELRDSLYMRRHGANTPLDALFKMNADKNRIRRIQALYADQDWLTLEQLADYADMLNLQPPHDLFAWANSLEEFAQSYFAERHGLDAELIDTDGKGEFVLYRGGPKFDEDLFKKNVRLIPDKFLQIKVAKQIRVFRKIANDTGFPD